MAESVEWPKYVIQFYPGSSQFCARTTVDGTELDGWASREYEAIDRLSFNAFNFGRLGEPELRTYERPDFSYKGGK